ncbi:MAG: matrixin family metalloprotease, partial [Oleiharenicola lentus]
MKNCANLLRRLGVLLAGLVAVTGAFAFVHIINDNTKLPIKWPAGTVQIRIMMGTSPSYSDGTAPNTTVQVAADTWNTRMGAVQISATQAAAGSASDTNNVNELSFASDVFGKAFEENVLAVTTGFSSGNERTRSDIVFNSAKQWDSYRGGLQTKVDLRRVALHELGHLLGLDHPDEATPVQSVAAIMNSHIGSL